MKHFFKYMIFVCTFCLTVVSQVNAGDTDKKIKAYPNPIEKGAVLTVEIQTGERVEKTVNLYNPVGKIILTLKTDNNIVEFNAPDISGIYLLRVVEKQKVIAVEKIVVKE